jgi:colanic acid/amylovoran biosynthesis glycosyltransferase
MRGPLVVSFLGFDANVVGYRYGGRHYADTFKRARIISVSSDFMANQLLALDAPRDRLVKLPLGLPVMRYAFRERVLTRGEPVRLVTVARLTEVKGIDWGLRAVALLLQSGALVEWDVIGDGPLRSQLEHLSEHLGITRAVRFHGARGSEFVREQLGSAHLCLYCGIRGQDGSEEALGGAVLEAQAVGLPVIATRVGGVPEGMIPGRSGLVVPQRDPAAIATAVRDLISRADEWPAMGHEGRRHVEQNYDAGRLNQQWVELYRSLS